MDEDGEGGILLNNRCDLLWHGALAKRMFTGFKFQESKNSAAAKKLLEGRAASHYWELAQRADSIQESAKLL